MSPSDTRPITKLPNELLCLIAEKLFDNSPRDGETHYGHDDRKNFRLVCKSFYKVVRTDRLFRILSLKNDIDVNHCIYHYGSLHEHPNIRLVKDLRLSVEDMLKSLPDTLPPDACVCQCLLPVKVKSRKERFRTGCAVCNFVVPLVGELPLVWFGTVPCEMTDTRFVLYLPSLVRLTQLHYLPSLERITYVLPDPNMETKSMQKHINSTNECLLMSLSEPALRITHLTLHNLHAQKCAAYSTPGWHNFLSGLHSLEICNSEAKYYGLPEIAFPSLFREHWLPHLTQLRELTLSSRWQFLFPVDPIYHYNYTGKFQVEGLRLPKLQKLKLSNAELDPEMVLSWLPEYSATLEVIVFEHCILPLLHPHLGQFLNYITGKMKALQNIQWVHGDIGKWDNWNKPTAKVFEELQRKLEIKRVRKALSRTPTYTRPTIYFIEEVEEITTIELGGWLRLWDHSVPGYYLRKWRNTPWVSPSI